METLRWLWFKFTGLPRYLLMTVAIVLIVIFLLYYPLGMLAANHIDDDISYRAGEEYDIAGGSHTVAMAEALINREINRNHWVANSPFFYPSSMLIRMPSFQRGIIAGLARFSVELSDQLGRARGSSQIDPDLEKATGLLKYSPNVWVFDFSTSLLPTTSSDEQYRAALAALQAYNTRLSKGQATFDRRADNLMEALRRISTDMGSSSAAIDERIHTYSGRIFDAQAAREFYFVKGRMYADYLILRELRKDFADIIRDKQLDAAWDNMLASLRDGAELGHFFVFNANLQSAFLPNHMAAQGFYLLRARTQLREVTDILLK